jgi:hypothetical protein
MKAAIVTHARASPGLRRAGVELEDGHRIVFLT